MLLAGTVLLAAGTWITWTGTARPEVVVARASVDFGPIAARRSQDVQIRNAGRAPLHVLAVTSSCGCTTARIGAALLPPGSGTQLTITFDPDAHGPDPGPAQHSVYLRTNDRRTPEAEIQVRAVVVKEKTR
ncbi:MAG: DUF1573 domain-containing protein [Armatimonadota bacterium]|nr:DUF1573 domain-containing protein [Armatimonadota bacterium]